MGCRTSVHHRARLKRTCGCRRRLALDLFIACQVALARSLRLIFITEIFRGTYSFVSGTYCSISSERSTTLGWHFFIAGYCVFSGVSAEACELHDAAWSPVQGPNVRSRRRHDALTHGHPRRRFAPRHLRCYGLELSECPSKSFLWVSPSASGR